MDSNAIGRTFTGVFASSFLESKDSTEFFKSFRGVKAEDEKTLIISVILAFRYRQS